MYDTGVVISTIQQQCRNFLFMTPMTQFLTYDTGVVISHVPHRCRNFFRYDTGFELYYILYWCRNVSYMAPVSQFLIRYANDAGVVIYYIRYRLGFAAHSSDRHKDYQGGTVLALSEATKELQQ